ncbi:MAG TPA: metalloregulator ArsR/SmtB family transcription factor [Luteitalea sp.]|nr:metalloregulator ArsR/SmtB family transcription factor [Luteitalea sp.]
MSQVTPASQTRSSRDSVPVSRRRSARPADAPLSAESAQALADTFRVLGDPTRIRLIAAMAVSERCVSDLAMLVGMSESAISHQLRLMRAARLVRTRRAGRQVFYTLDDAHILALYQQAVSHVHEPQGDQR